MYVWLDDTRDPSLYGTRNYTWCRTFSEACAMLLTGNVLFISVDHDLSLEAACGSPNLGEKNGFDLLEFMQDKQCWPKDGVVVHAGSEVNVRRMHEAIMRHYDRIDFPYAEEKVAVKANEPYTYQAYPAWRYHQGGEAMLVSTPEQDERLGAGWGKSPKGPFAEALPSEDILSPEPPKGLQPLRPPVKGNRGR